MKKLVLSEYQIDAIKRLGNGKILRGDVGVGKSRTALAYYFFRIAKGSVPVNGNGEERKMKNKIDLYIITTAAKRNKREWDDELEPFGLKVGENPKHGINIVVDSWQKIKAYTNVQNAFFIFDEQKLCGKGVWVRSFYKIAKNNLWILATATPGDVWNDYVPVFIANDFFRNRTDFERHHVVFKQFSKFKQIESYVYTKILEKYLSMILVNMEKPPEIASRVERHHDKILCAYNQTVYKRVMKLRIDPDTGEPFENASALCYALRKVTNTNRERYTTTIELVDAHRKVIIFYNFNYERDILRHIADDLKINVGEWNGEKHDPIPKGDAWVYLVQYTAGAEGWNCIECNTIIFYSQNYSYKVTTQAAGRIDRVNTPYKDLYYYHLTSRAPIDLAIGRALKNKEVFNERAFAL